MELKKKKKKFSDSYYYFTSNLIIFIRGEVKIKFYHQKKTPNKQTTKNWTAKKGGQWY